MFIQVKNKQKSSLFFLEEENKQLFIQKIKKKYGLQDDFLIILNRFSLEDLISLKLCISTNIIDYKLWKLFDKVIKKSLLNVVDNFTNDTNLKAKLLGIPKDRLAIVRKKYREIRDE
jgi:hypothetical protein